MLEQRPLTSAEMLATLSDRLDRFASLRPLGSSSVKLEDRKGSLYEYLEGVLLRSISVDGARSHQMAVYDLRDLVADPAGAAAETEAEEAGEGEAVVLDEQQDAQTSASASASGSAPVVATSTTAVENDEAQMVVDMALAADWSDEDWIDVDDVDGDQSSDDDDDDENEDGSDGNDSESVADSNDSSDEDEDADMAGGDDDESDLDGDPIVPGMFDIVFESDKPPSPIGSTGSNITDPNEAGLRRVHSCDFKVRELAVDPGQDLLVLVSSR
jgi:hypothetical protein